MRLLDKKKRVIIEMSDPLDFLVKVNSDLLKIEAFIQSSGYEVETISQHYRLFVNADRKDLAAKFLEEFNAVYSMDEADKNAYKWAQVYKLLAGLNEAKDEPLCLPAINELMREFSA